MTKPQWKAIYDFCDYNMITLNDLLYELKESGAVPKGTKLPEVGEYTNGTTYQDMMRFLQENINY